MNIEQAEYLPNITSKAGVRVAVHPQSHFPFPEDVGVDVSVGMSTSIGLKKVCKNQIAHEIHSTRKRSISLCSSTYSDPCL